MDPRRVIPILVDKLHAKSAEISKFVVSIRIESRLAFEPMQKCPTISKMQAWDEAMTSVHEALNYTDRMDQCEVGMNRKGDG